jgi:hypothetical protein
MEVNDGTKAQGQAVGSWTSRQGGHAEYRKVIDAYRLEHPDKLSGWDRIRDNWNNPPAQGKAQRSRQIKKGELWKTVRLKMR